MRRQRTGARKKPSGSQFDFGKLAATYDHWYQQPLAAVYDRVEKDAFRQVLPDPARGKRLLEVGAGTGHWSAFFADEGFEVTAVDVSVEMVEFARSKKINNVCFQVADAGALPYPEGSFDVVVAITTLEFLPDMGKAVGEMARCLKAGGKMVLGVLNALSYQAWRRRRSSSPLWQSAQFLSAAELRQLLARYGKTSVRCAGFLIPWRGLLWLAPITEALGRWLEVPFGDFIVAEVSYDGSG